MKIIKKGLTLNNERIQIENWREDYPHIKTLSIGVYPVAKNTGSGLFDPTRGETFRADIKDYLTDEDVYTLFEDLEQGRVSIEDIKSRLRSTHNLKEIF